MSEEKKNPSNPIKNLSGLARRLETDTEQVRQHLTNLSALDMELQSVHESIAKAEADVAAHGKAAQEAADKRRQLLAEPRARMLKVLHDAQESLADYASRVKTVLTQCGAKPISDVVPILNIGNTIKEFNDKISRVGSDFGEETKQLAGQIQETLKTEKSAKESIETSAGQANKLKARKKVLEAEINNLLEHPLVKSARMVSEAESYHGRLRKEAEEALSQAKHEASVASNERQKANDALKAAEAKLKEIETNGAERLQKIDAQEKEKKATVEALENKAKELESRRRSLEADIKYMGDLIKKRKDMEAIASGSK